MLRRNFGNHFTITSTKDSLEFAHGEKEPNAQIRLNEDGFRFHHLIDTGGFGFVFKATRKTTRKTYALKVQPLEFMARLSGGPHQKPNEVSLQTEKTVLAACRGHHFVVSLEYAFITSLYAILALEYVPGGTLSRLISQSPGARLPCDLARIYTAEIALALNFMHGKGIIYRDVKPSNILIDIDGHIKVTDFGLAGSMLAKKKAVNPQENSAVDAESTSEPSREDGADDESMGSSDESVSSEDPEWTEDEPTDGIQGDLRRVRRRTLCGTAGYRPPEQVGERYLDYRNRSGYDERVDFFSLGVTLFTMVCGRRPFPTRKQMLSRQEDLVGASSPSRTRRSSLSDLNRSDALQRAARRKLMKDIEYRCLMAEVTFPDFMLDSEAKSFIHQLLAKDPDDRPRFDGIKDHPWMSDVEFDAAKLKATKIPADWVLKHALQESQSRPRPMRRSSVSSPHRAKTDLSLNLFIEDICAQMIEIGKGEDAENASARWLAPPTAKTMALFRHWNFISKDALKLEIIAAANGSRGKLGRYRHMRRATQ